jgi:hypothetical protein
MVKYEKNTYLSGESRLEKTRNFSLFCLKLAIALYNLCIRLALNKFDKVIEKNKVAIVFKSKALI